MQLSLFKKKFINLLVDEIKSVVASRILELPLELSDKFPKRKVFVKMLLIFSNKLWLKLLNVLKRVRLFLKKN